MMVLFRVLRAPGIAAILILGLGRGGARGAEGIFGIGTGARAMAMGGIGAASPEGALVSLAANPAGLSLLSQPELDAGVLSAIPYGRFTSANGQGGSLSSRLEAAPEGALSLPIPHSPFTVGAGISPEASLSAHWHYRDPAGGLGGTASYGFQRDDSQIEVLRMSLGVGIAITRQLSIGGSLGFDYNENRLRTPYVFQSQPVLRGFKTLLDLQTSGWGANGSAGVLYRPTETVSIGLSYQSRTLIKTHGDAAGSAGAQLNALGPGFAGVRRDFHYDAEVDNTLPQMVSGGVSWKFRPRWEVAAQIDWINWSDAFDSLPVKLTHGNNADLNGLVGANRLQDNIPLQWRDRFAYRLGLEHELNDSFVLRAGYSYSKSPVPSETLSPLTAAIPEHSLTAGAGYRWRWLELDLAYEWDLPTTEHVGQSALAAGEYSDSSTRVGIQWLSLTSRVKF